MQGATGFGFAHFLSVHRNAGGYVNRALLFLAEFFSKPPGFYVLIASTLACTLIAMLGFVEVTTYYLSVLAIVLSGVVLIQNYRDTAAMQAKLDEIVIALNEARNDVVGLEHATPEEIKKELRHIEARAVAEASS